jgi:Flp pilus assembly pilin Flp
MQQMFRLFAKDESGAVTVDWVVLTAAVVGLGMVVLVPIAFTTDSSAQGVSDYISNINVGFDNQ